MAANAKMKSLLLLLPLVLCSCEVLHRPGIVIKEEVSYTGKYGPGTKMQDKVTLNADMPGLKSVEAAGVKIAFAPGTITTVTTATDSRTGIVTVSNSTKPSGLYVSEHVAARGDADKSRIKETSAGVSGAIVSGAGAALIGPGVGAIPR